MVDRRARLREQARWLVLAIAGVVLVAHSLAFNFVTDDAYISFVYSRNFAEHGELAFNLGDPVEGYTNFSWTVLLGLVMKLGIAPELSSRVLGTICALGTLCLVMRTMERALGRRSAWAAVPSVLLACSSGFACWTSGGLETQLFTVLVAGALDAVVAAVTEPRALRRAAVCLALAAMTRPEGPVVAAVLGAVWLVHRWLESRAKLPAAVAIDKPEPPSPRARSPVVFGGAVVLVAMIVGALGRISSLGSTLGAAYAALAIVVIGISLVGLLYGARPSNLHALARLGAVLLGLGLLVMAGAIRHGEAVAGNRAVAFALLSIVLGCLGLGLALASIPRTRGIRAELVAAAWFLGLWAPWFLWRWWYYGHPFPNTYYVKAAGDWTNPEFASQMRDHGLYYVWVWLVQTRLVFALPVALLGMLAIKPRTPRFVLGAACLLLTVVYLGYTVTVGGDFMGLHRFIMPVFVAAAIAVVLGVEWLSSWLPTGAIVFPGSPRLLGALILVAGALVAFSYSEFPDDARRLLDLTEPRRWVPVIGAIAAAMPLAIGRMSGRHIATSAGILLVVAFATTQAHLTARSLDPKNLAADRGVIDTPAFLIVYTEDRAKIGRAMAPCFTDGDFSIVGGAGAQPYFGRMRAIDVFGLVSDKIAHREPRSRARAGHTKWGSENLLAEYDPDFVFSCYRIHKTPAQPQLGCAAGWARRGFEHVTMHIPGMREQGEYYTFLAKKSRAFSCPGRVK
jgi:hypothetical protein